jgi:hypothetical protein
VQVKIISPNHALQKWGELGKCLFLFVILTAMMLAVGSIRTNFGSQMEKLERLLDNSAPVLMVTTIFSLLSKT